MKQLNNDEIREAVCSHYGKTAGGCCGGPAPKETDACCVADAEAKAAGAGGCGCNVTQPEVASDKAGETLAKRKVLNIDLLVIDLETCKRCVPTGDQTKTAVKLLQPVAEGLGIELRHNEIVVQTTAEAKANALLTSPTIRLNGRDIAQDIRESACESCGDLTNNTSVDCREWNYRGKVFPAVPLPLLIEAIMVAMQNIDDLPLVVPAPLEELPENLQRYFDNRKEGKVGSHAENRR